MSRIKRRERRHNRLSLPLAFIIFAASVLIIGAVTIGVVALVASSHLENLEQRATMELSGKVTLVSQAIELDLAPAKILLPTVRDMLVAEPALASNPDALRVRAIPLLRHLPGILSLQVRLGETQAWEITRDGENWLTRRTENSHPAHATIWERWSSGGTERLSDQPDMPMPRPGDDSGYQKALDAAHGRPDGNRFGTPKYLWGPPGRDTRSGHPMLSVDLVMDNEADDTIWIRANVDFKGTNQQSADDSVFENELALVAMRDGTLLAPPDDAGMPTAKRAPAIGDFSQQPMGIALHRWLTDTFPPDGAFSYRVSGEGWWFEALPHPIGEGQELIVLAGVPDALLLEDEHLLRDRLLGGIVLSLFIALSVSAILGRVLGQPLREFIRRTRRTDIIDRAGGLRPRSLVREVDRLYEALDDLCGEVSERLHSREMPLIITAEARPKPDTGSTDAITLQSEEQSLEAGGTTEAEAAAPYVPEAYVQAIQSTRRKLRELSEELDAHRASMLTLEHRKEEEAQLWSKVRDAAAGLSSALAQRGDDFDAFAVECARGLGQAVDAGRCSIWLVEGAFDRLLLLHRADRHEPETHAQIELEREAHTLFFGALDASPCLSVRDAARDPRTASYVAAVPWTPNPTALLAAPVRVHEGIVAVLVAERTTSSAPWPTASESLICMSTAALAASWELSKRPLALAHAPKPELAGEDEYTESPLFRQLLEGAAGAVLALDRAGRVTYANAAAEQLYGRPPQDWPGVSLAQLSASGFAINDAQALRRILEGELRVDTDTEHVTAGGGSTPLRLTWSPLQDEEGEINGAVVLAVDIRDIKDHQGELKRSEARFRGYVEELAGVFFSLDTIGCINYVSPAVRRIYGYAPSELTGQPIAMLTSEEQSELDRDALAALLDGAACIGYETTHRTNTGEPIPLLVFASPHRDDEARLSGITGVAFRRSQKDPA